MKQGKANRVLPREHTGHSKHPLPTTEEMTLHMDITRWSISDPITSWQIDGETIETMTDIILLTKVCLGKAMVFQWSCMDVRFGL